MAWERGGFSENLLYLYSQYLHSEGKSGLGTKRFLRKFPLLCVHNTRIVKEKVAWERGGEMLATKQKNTTPILGNAKSIFGNTFSSKNYFQSIC